MADLDVRTLAQTIEQALWDTLSLGYEVRLAPVADVAALRAAPAQTVRDRALRYVTAAGVLYRWSTSSTATDNGTTVVAPTTPPYGAATNGRWLRVETPGYFGPNKNAPLRSKQTGYARSVVTYQGEGKGESPKQVAEAIFGQSPAFLVEWLGDDPRNASVGVRAGWYKDTLEFQIMCYSESLRGRPFALLGSVIAAEAAKDPGLQRMIGDVRYLLAGSQLGLAPGVDLVEIGRSDIVSQDLDERVFLGSVQISVKCSFAIPDEDLETMAIQLSPKWTDAPSRFDPLNYVASGLRIPLGSGLTVTPEAGTVFVGGVAVASAPGSVTLTANRDTYRDVDDGGVWTYSAVPVGDPAPAVAADSLRVAVTTTNGSAVIGDRWLCSSSVPLWTPPGVMTID